MSAVLDRTGSIEPEDDLDLDGWDDEPDEDAAASLRVQSSPGEARRSVEAYFEEKRLKGLLSDAFDEDD